MFERLLMIIKDYSEARIHQINANNALCNTSARNLVFMINMQEHKKELKFKKALHDLSCHRKHRDQTLDQERCFNKK